MALMLLCSCHERKDAPANVPIFVEPTEVNDSIERCDLDEIRDAGVIIAGTLSGPDTYYEYHGKWIGLQYEMARDFAQSIGVRLRMEVYPDTATLLDVLGKGEIDFIALEMPRWETRDDEPLLREAMRKWWQPMRKERMMQAINNRSTQPMKRKMRPAMMDLAHGIISQYDDYFRHYGAAIGWDWRLLAAQCYQESGFDPNAVSWMGAIGLMQIMPSTASVMGVDKSRLTDPETSISTATRYLQKVYAGFNDIPDRQERICFTLAAYNGGSMHVRDAMALAGKYGASPYVWNDVSPFILRLAEPAFYRDPVVKHGYMRGSETYNYVSRIMERWQSYRECARGANLSSQPSPAKKSVKEGEFKSRVKSAEEWVPDTL